MSAIIRSWDAVHPIALPCLFNYLHGCRAGSTMVQRRPSSWSSRRTGRRNVRMSFSEEKD